MAYPNGEYFTFDFENFQSYNAAPIKIAWSGTSAYRIQEEIDSLSRQCMTERGGISESEASSIVAEARKSCSEPTNFFSVLRQIKHIYLARGYLQFWTEDE